MSEVAQFILNNPTKSNEIITKVYDFAIDFIKIYNNDTTLDKYTPKRVEILDSTPDLLIMREAIYSISQNSATLKIKSSDEFKNDGNDTYFIIKTNTDVLIKMMIAYTVFYLLDSVHSKKKLLIGLDYEFNMRKIALCQAGFFPKRKHKYIFIHDPNMLTQDQQNVLTKTMYTSPIYRIVHGSDSLDIPYLFSEVFKQDTEKILNFAKTVIDTRFLCEYFKLYTNHTDNKCSIYDALMFFNVITKEKYDDLQNVNVGMGPVQDVNWNVRNMSSFHLKYAMYDVLFLKQFVMGIVKESEKINRDLRYHIYFLIELTRFIYFEKNGVSDLLQKTKTLIDPINNYFVTTTTGNITLIEIYTKLVNNLVTYPHNLPIAKLMGINYFKSALTFLIKRFVYSVATNKYKTYINKKTTFNDKIQIDDVYDTFNKLHLNKLIRWTKDTMSKIHI